MSEIPQLPAAFPEAIRPARPASTGEAGALAGGRTPAFEALLERLESHAAELDEKSKALRGPAELPGAMDAARASLEDALRLGEELLEAYHAARRAPESSP